MIIKTNYSGPYRIKNVSRGCTCPSYIDEISMQDPPPGPPHIHVVCTKTDGTGEFFLTRWDENTLRSLDKTYCGMKTSLDYDWIEVLGCDKPVQLSMF
jgi:hypothetical protein